MVNEMGVSEDGNSAVPFPILFNDVLLHLWITYHTDKIITNEKMGKRQSKQ
jgi:hypothetical protein